MCRRSMADFTDKTVLVTGSRGRLGAAAAALLASLGATVVGADLPEALDIPATAPVVDEVPCDLTIENEVAALAHHVASWHDRLDGILHTTYAQAEAELAELSLADWNRVVAGCLTSGFLVCKHLVPLLARSGGALVTTSSVLGREPTRANGAYGAAKAGLAQLTRVAAVEYAAAGVRCVVLEPGDFKTRREVDEMSASQRSTIERATLAGRSATPDEVARVAAFLLSDDAGYVNGVVVAADGGFHGYTGLL